MKFKIRHADQLVGLFSIVALVALVFLIFALGGKQHWFTKKYIFHTEFLSASNLSVGMNVEYKGFAIGKIKNIELINDKVQVDFYILEKYHSYCKEGSLIQLLSSPIGLGTQFVFCPGNGEQLLDDESFIYNLDSPEGKEIVDNEMNFVQKQTDSIGALLSNVSSLIDNVNTLIVEINGAMSGKGNSTITRLLKNVQGTMENVESLTTSITESGTLVEGVVGENYANQIENILGNINKILVDVSSISSSADAILSSGSPQVDSVLGQINLLLVQVSDILTGVKNNPLIKGGVPDRSTAVTPTTGSRNTDF